MTNRHRSSSSDQVPQHRTLHLLERRDQLRDLLQERMPGHETSWMQSRHLVETLNVNLRKEITERQKTEEQLRLHEQNLAAELIATQRLHEDSTQLIQADDCGKLYDAILDTAVGIMDSEFASLQMFHPERGINGELQLLGSRGFNPQAVKFWEWVGVDSNSACGTALRTMQRCIVPDVEKCEFMFGGNLDTCLQNGIHAIQTTLLLSRTGRLIGMLSTHWREVYEPTTRELRLIDILARQAADLIERKQAEVRLHQNNNTFSNLIQNAPFGLYVVDAQFRLSQVSTANDNMAVESYDWKIERMTLPNGEFGVVCYFYDVSERYRAATALRESEERYRALVTASSDVFYRMNPDWSVVSHLDGRDFIADAQTPTTSWLQEYIHPDDQSQVMAVINEAIRTRTPFEMEHRVRLVDETWGWTFSRAVPQWDAQGEIQEWFGAASDVTKRHRAEEALRESEERYRTLLTSMDEGFMVIEMILDEQEKPVDYRVLEVNPTCEKQPGMHNAFGRRVRGDLFPDIEDHWIETYGKVARTGESVRFVNESKAMEGRWFDVYACRVGGPGSPKVAVVFNDITERKRYEAQIQTLNRDLELRVIARTSDLQATVGVLETEMIARKRLEREILEISEREQCRLGQDLHDGLGQELAGIALLGKVLSSTLTEESHPCAKAAADIAEYTRDTIDSARRLAKGLYPVELSRYGLHLALEDLAEQTSRRLGIRCEFRHTLDAPLLEAGAEIQIFRIVQECIANAIKHGNARRIIIKSRPGDGIHTFTVSNDGLPFEERISSGLGVHLMHYRTRLIGGDNYHQKVLRERLPCYATTACFWKGVLI